MIYRECLHPCQRQSGHSERARLIDYLWTLYNHVTSSDVEFAYKTQDRDGSIDQNMGPGFTKTEGIVIIKYIISVECCDSHTHSNALPPSKYYRKRDLATQRALPDSLAA